MRVLSALAIHPKASWDILVSLDKIIGGEFGREKRLFLYSKLEYFKKSFWVPDWLRRELINRLDVDEKLELRKIFQSNFSKILDNMNYDEIYTTFMFSSFCKRVSLKLARLAN